MKTTNKPRPAPFENYNRLPKVDSTPMVLLDAQQAFELWAEVYDDTPNPIVQLSERTILERISGSSRALRVLDLACGTGRLLPELLKLGYQCCVGVDSSEAMLRKAGLRGEIKSNLIRADAHALPLASGSIDLLILALALSYFKDLGRIASELSRVLGPKGRILCTDFHPTACQYGWKRSFKTKTTDIEVSYFDHSIRNVGISFSKYFELIGTTDLQFGKKEFSSFVRAGKSHVFEETRKIPALVFFDWIKPA